MNFLKIYSTSLFLVLGLLSAQGYGSFAGGFLRMGSSARGMAMGNAFTAVIDRGSAAYNNPASMSFLKNKQVGFSNHFLPLDRNFMAASFSAPLPPIAAVGFSWIQSGVKNIDGRNTSGMHTSYLAASENAYIMSFSQIVLSKISVGLNIKILSHQLPMNSMNLSGKGIGMDFGFFIKTKSGNNLGFMIQDLNSQYTWKTDKVFEKGKVYVEPFPTLYRIGTSFMYNNIFVVTDGGLIMNGSKSLGYTFRIGGEYKYLDNYFLRAGFGLGRISVGLGLDWSLLKDNDSRLDYAFVFENPAGAAHVFTYAFSF